MYDMVNRDYGNVIRHQEVADLACGLWQDSPTLSSSSYPSIQLHVLMRGTTLIRRSPTILLPLSVFSLSLSLSECLSSSGNIFPKCLLQ